MSNPPDTYQKILQAIPDILSSLNELYAQGRGSPAPGSSSTLVSGVGGSSAFSSSSSVGQGINSLTGVRPASKPFIIGFIPPDVRTSFVPVDRSNVTLETTGTAGSSVSFSTETLDTSGARASSALPDSFYRAMTKVAHNVGCRPSDLLLMLWMESGIKPDADNHVDGDPSKPVQARGINQITSRAVKSSGLTMEEWKNSYSKLSAEQQLPYVERYLKNVSKGPYENAAQIKLANFAPSKVSKASDPNAVLYSKYKSDGKTIDNRWKQNSSMNPDGDITVANMLAKIQVKASSPAFLSQLARLKSVVGEDVAVARPSGAKLNKIITAGGTEDPTLNKILNAGDVETDSLDSGSVASIMVSGNISSTDPVDELSITGRNIVLSDKRREVVEKQTNELQKQIDTANRIPSLLMLVNPSEFTRNYEHQVDYPKGRRGPIVHMWLEKPLQISSKGVTAAQYAFGPTEDSLNQKDLSINPSKARSDYPFQGGGLTHQYRLHSLSYVNFMSLVMMYRNNGHLYTQAVTGDSHNWGIPVISMSVFLYYDSHIYIGSFDDFSVTDDAEKPFSLSYNWKFTSRYDFEVTEINDIVVSNQTGGQYDANAFPRELSTARRIDEGTAVPDEELGPTPSSFPVFPPSKAPTGIAPDVGDFPITTNGEILT